MERLRSVAVSELVKRGTGAVADGLIARVRAWLRRLRRRRTPAPRATVPPLTPRQLDAVHERTRERAAQAGLDWPEAERLADAVVSVLAGAARD